MPVSPTYPGIYIQEAPSSSHTILSAPTNIAVFIGYTHLFKTKAEHLGKPVQIFGFSDYQREFGGFVRSVAFANASKAFGDMAQALNQFFLNGGTNAYIVSVNPASGVFPTPPQGLDIGGIVFTQLEVTDELFMMSVEIRPNPATSPPSDPVADIIVTYGPAPHQSTSPPSSPTISAGPATVVETYRRVSLDKQSPNYILNSMAASSLVKVALSSPPPSSFPSPRPTSPPASPPTTVSKYVFPDLLPGNTVFYSAAHFTAVMQDDTQLDKLPVFNLMVLPGISNNSQSGGDPSGGMILSTAAAFCERKRAFLIIDPPINDTADGSDNSNPIANSVSVIPNSKNAALYFPYLYSTDPLTGNINEIPPAATVAGIYATTDLARGVWKAPAGFQATAKNVTGVVARGRMTDPRQGTLNPLGVNCLRDFPNLPTIVFGARTLVTQTEEQWRYVPVRRMALFLEQTFYANLKWVIFEPNDEPLWTAITMSINAFMLGLFKQGAFQGSKPSEAFSVQCNRQTTTQADINSGIVNIVVGFAPLKPAEFVIITIAQLAGQAQT
jgi:hypothetical protein